MPTDAQIERKRLLKLAEIEARRAADREKLLGLLAGFDPEGGVATRSVMPPDPTFSGVPGQSEFLRGAPIGSQVAPGQKKTILDRLIQPPVDVPMVDMPPMAIGRDRPFPMERRVDVPVVNRGDLERLEPVTSRFMPSVPPPMRGREPTTTMYPAYTDAMAAFDQLVKAKAAEAERVDDPRDSNLALVAAARADVAEMQADIDKKFADRRAQAAGTAVPTALIPRAEPTQQQPTRPYWDSIESIYGPNVRARVGDARADEMEMDRFGPAVTPGAVTRAPTTQRKTSSQVVDYIGQIEKRKRILSAVSNIWGTKNNSSTYEANALAKLNEHLGTQALRNLTDADMQSQLSIFRALVKNDAPLGVLKSVMGMSLQAPKVTSQLKPIRVGDEWVTYEVFSDGSKKVFARSPIQKQTTETTIKMPKGQTATQEVLGKRFAEYIGDALYGDEEKMFYQLKRDNMQIGPLLDAIESGAVETGTGQRFFTRIQAALGQFLPASESQRLNDKQAGMAEWWKATSDSFIGLKLAMTKGAISDREMKLFMAMIPQLSMTEEGNIRLLKSMKALNDVARGVQLGAYDWVADLKKRGLAVGDRDATVENIEVKKFIDRRQEIAIKEFDRVAVGLPDTREEAFAIMRDDPQFEQYSEDDLQNYLDKYYPKRSEQ